MRSHVKNTSVSLAIALAVVVATAVAAHEGHEHKVMGTVAVLHENHLEVKATDGKAVTFVLNAKTKILKGKTPIKAADIRVGDRVVVTAAESKDGQVAKEIRVGENAAESGKS